MGFFRPTAAEIHLDALRHNFKQVSKLLKPAVRIMAMVKADAYGHGAVPVSRVLSACGAASLGVATVEEGLELRESAISTPVVVLGGLMGVGSAAAGMMIGADLTPVVHSAEVLDFLEATAHAASKKIGIHLK
ncbi:MAG: alanine racemase, partial [Deltaproteobacteria bacterium]|nr:alanine racemase [Deltaproteobacteria bacterium]